MTDSVSTKSAATSGIPPNMGPLPDSENALEGSAPERDLVRGSGLLEQLVRDSRVEQASSSFESVDEIAALEWRHEASSFVARYLRQEDLDARSRALAPLVRSRHCVEAVGNQFAKKLLEPFMLAHTDEAFRVYRGTPAHTIDEELALLLNQVQFAELYERLHEHLELVRDQTFTTAEQRLATKPLGAITFSDFHQFNGREKRSVDQMRKVGITVSVSAEHRDELSRTLIRSNATGIPMTEYLKNSCIASINGFDDCKLSLVVHDSMDHAWTFSVLEGTGVLGKFHGLFESIGDPAYTDIFKREGEAVASIAFGLRYWSLVKPGFVPLHTADELLQRFDYFFDGGVLDERHIKAYRILRSLEPYSSQWQSLGYCFSNYVVELDEQRRKHGKIKQRDPISKRIVGELGEWQPDYLAFFIESHNELVRSRNKHRDDLFRFQLLLEEFLTQAARGTIPIDQPLSVNFDEIRDLDFEELSLTAPRISWIFKHYGFAASREPVR